MSVLVRGVRGVGREYVGLHVVLGLAGGQLVGHAVLGAEDVAAFAARGLHDPGKKRWTC